MKNLIMVLILLTSTFTFANSGKSVEEIASALQTKVNDMQWQYAPGLTYTQEDTIIVPVVSATRQLNRALRRRGFRDLFIARNKAASLKKTNRRSIRLASSLRGQQELKAFLKRVDGVADVMIKMIDKKIREGQRRISPTADRAVRSGRGGLF